MLDRLSILQRIALGFAAVTVVLVATCAVALSVIGAMSDRFEDYRRTSAQAAALKDFSEDLFEMRLAAYAFRVRGDRAQLAVAERSAEELLAFAREAEARFADRPDLTGPILALARDVRLYADTFAAAVEADTARAAALASADAAVRSAGAALERLRDSAADRARAQLSVAAARAQTHLLAARERVTALLATGDPGAMTEAQAELEAAMAELEILRDEAAAIGLGGESFEAAGQLRAAAEAFVALDAAATARREAFSGRLDVIGPSMKDRGETLAEDLAGAAALMAAEKSTAAAEGRMLVSVGAAVALALAVAMALVVARWIGGAVRDIAGQMRRLAEGDTAIAVERHARHAHELGQMARALGVFRDTQAALARAEAEKAATARAAQAERREMMGRLQAAFGAAVDAGVAGDFGARVAADFPDPELNALAEAVNRLMQSADRGLGAAVAAMERLAEGDLGARMSGEFAGAFARLQASVDDTVGRLAEVVEEIRRAAEDIAGAMKGMAGDADELSARTESQAASLEETAATMEEISATVRANAESARAAAALSREAAERADAGAGTMRRTVEVIGRIEEGATRIAEITTVIDSIAFQTNLLALNAAVEAARAGEAGKGFAVVAAEVRGLAQRSAEAASDIKGLIETSGRQVGEGAEAARRAGAALDEIVAVVRRLDGAIAEITSAGAEQASGVEEISAAVASLDETTQRNAAAAQSGARAAAAVAETARRLTALTGRFRAREGAVRARAA